MKSTRFWLLMLPLVSHQALADWSATLTAVSDYLFNGVSQTDEKPALQGSVDWASQNGWYAGVWGSNVDFGDDTKIEADIYGGYYLDLSDSLNLDVGLAQYTYHGASYSSEGNYPEAYMKWGIGNTSFNLWYSWDYFGTGAGHYIVMLNHNVQVSDSFSILLGIDKSTSLDKDKWQWEAGDDDYIHWQATANFSRWGLDMSVGVQGTDLDSYGDTKVLFTIGRTFTF
ncbi:TorF family putative porin [Bowmanella sp. Y26]|uniref:TorF family putative porin n=1 Tax=Bowmanella yangjiangensis TaxID=2811230 RepID=UPI001BDD62CD|nr:TorF family putative porin [Bowmanella yangjiangensis]MBT1063472.1 TorF family putative porin [Bowmanella yangjiangensis]